MMTEKKTVLQMKKGMTRSNVLSNLVWKLMQSAGTEGVQFVMQIILARLLLPKDFGMIALIIVFISLANVIIQSSFNTALIQKFNANEEDFSSIFYINLFVAGFLYIILFFTAPCIAAFYDEALLIPLLRVLSVTLFTGAVNSIQIAVISRNMQFKKLFFSSLSAMVLSGIVGIAMAYSGFGVWALAAYRITNQFLNTLTLWLTVKWRPKLFFSFKRAQDLFSFGWKVLASSLISTFYDNLLSLIIGKLYNASTLGFYQRGLQFPLVFAFNINDSFQAVMFPAFASQQDNHEKVKSMVRRSISVSVFIIFPMMAGLAAVAEPLVRALLTDKWLPSVPFIQAYCLACALLPVHTANVQAINALGRSDVTLKLEMVKRILALTILCVTVHFGVYAIAFGAAAAQLIFTVINAYPNKKMLNYSYMEQWKDIMPSLLMSLVMGIAVYSVQLIEFNIWLTLIIKIMIGIVFYIILAKLFKPKCFVYILASVKDILEQGNKNH